jgi:hypothetical protein
MSVGPSWACGDARVKAAANPRGILGCVRPVSHGAPSPRHITERVARDTPRAGRCETLLSASSVYAFSDHGPIVATFED